MKEFNSQVCTTKIQSQRLLDLGLKPETADCQYAALVIDWKGNPILNPKWRFYNHNKGFIVQNFEQMESIPAWSLHRLLLLCDVTAMFTRDILETAYDDQINAIENLIMNGYFNKEYLKQ
jgi:hypothetical protein